MTSAVAVKERPILMCGWKVRRILDWNFAASGDMQTRRIHKFQPNYGVYSTQPWTCGLCDDRQSWQFNSPLTADRYTSKCPYGCPGDRLWVREAWGELSWTCVIGERGLQRTEVVYKAGPHPFESDKPHGWTEGKNKWRPSIHMRRQASRLTLEITGVGVERLRDISESDAISEGVSAIENPDYDADDPCDDEEFSHVAAFAELWDQINGPGSWESNPWVWVVSFRRVEMPEVAHV